MRMQLVQVIEFNDNSSVNTADGWGKKKKSEMSLNIKEHSIPLTHAYKRTVFHN